MKTITLLRENIKKHKGNFVGVFILMFIIVVSSSAVLTIWDNSRSYIRSQMDRVEFGDLIYWMNKNDSETDGIKAKLEEIQGIEKVVKKNNIIFLARVNGYEPNTTYFAYEYDGSDKDFKIFDGNSTEYYKSTQLLDKGQIYVPVTMKNICDAKIGDSFEIKGAGEYTIKGFFEDPTAGSASMGMKNILVSEEDFKELSKGENKEYTYACMLNIFMKEGSSVAEVQKNITEEINLKRYLVFSYYASSIEGFMLLNQNIFMAILLGFVLILLIISIIVIGHSISTGIEQSYTDLGILKALGYTKANLMWVMALQYLVPILSALVIGLAVSPLLIAGINTIILPATGVFFPATISVQTVFTALTLMLLILIIFIMANVNKIGRITPIKAIRGGKSDVFFNSRIHFQLHGKGLQFWLALRQITSGMKRYIGACVITMLLMFFIAFTSRLFGWLGANGEGLMKAAGVASVNDKIYDLGVYYNDKEIQDEVEQDIRKYSPIEVWYTSKVRGVQINGVEIIANAISNTEYLNMLKGRYCKYDNEIVITEIMADALKADIGDTIELAVDNKKAEYIITGINQCANDLGQNISMSMEAYGRIGNDDECMYNYVLEDQNRKEKVIDCLKEKYDEKIVIDDNSWSGIDAIVSASKALSILVYIICGIFIFVVVSMTGGKLLFREKQDLGIYKALGFNSGVLRVSFALRFLLVAIIGSILGCGLSIYITDPLAGKLFKFAGVGYFQSEINVIMMLAEMGLVVGIFFVFSYLIAGKIKKTNPNILIQV
ncbi:MAG: ABC transporter permease [Agathobacter sp.]|nr:ABC transporter permease [Agathobacter sp.]